MAENEVKTYDTYMVLRQVVPKPYKEGFRADGYEVVVEVIMPKDIDIKEVLIKSIKKHKPHKV